MTQWIISSSILIFVVIGLRFLLRRRIRPILQYGLWALVLVRLLVPVQLGSTGFSLENAVEKAPVVQQMELAEEVDHFVYHVDGTATGYYAYQPSIDRTEPEVYKPAPQVFTQQEAKRLTRMRDIKGLLEKVWLGGMAVFGLVFLLSNLRFALRLRKSQKAGNAGNLPIFITDKVETPCLFGLLRPAIYLPPAVAAEQRHRDYSVAHEMTHFRHGDALWSVLRCVCLVLHWYNPLVWWAAILSREDAEIACDDATICALGEELRGDYGRVLVDLTCRKPTDLLQTATTMTGSAKGLKQRIHMIVKRPKMAVYALICLILVASVTIGCTFTGGKKPDKQTGDPMETTESTENTEPTDSKKDTPTQPVRKELLPDTIPGTPLTDEELAYFTELFSGIYKDNGEINWYNILLFCGWHLGEAKGFAVPEDVNLDTLFNNGFGAISYDSNWTPEELAFIQGFYPGYPENYKERYRLPAPMMNQVMQTYLGISLEQSNKVWLDKMKYFPDTDCYFTTPAGAVGEPNIYLVDGKKAEDGTVYLLHRNDRSFLDSAALIRLVPTVGNEQAPYQVLSCVEIENESDYTAFMQAIQRQP